MRFAVAHFDSAAVYIDDFLRDGEPEAHALAGGFRAEERLEKLAEMLGRDARAGIGDLDGDDALALAKLRAAAISDVERGCVRRCHRSRDRERSAARHRLN